MIWWYIYHQTYSKNTLNHIHIFATSFSAASISQSINSASPFVTCSSFNVDYYFPQKEKKKKKRRSYDLNTESVTIKESVKSHINLVNFCFLTFWEKKFKKNHHAYMIYNKESHFFQMSTHIFQVYPERVTL